MIRKLPALCLVLLGLAFGQQNTGSIQTETDITGTNATVAICSTCGTAKWVQIVTPAANAAVVRWGDSNTSSTRGAIIAAGGGQYLPPDGGPYSLPNLYVFIATNDKVTVTWGY